MKIGITGTSSGMSDEQKFSFETLMEQLTPDELHEGCCIGVDSEAYIYAKERSIFTVGHPGFYAKNPDDLSKRDIRQRDCMMEATNHFARNRNIVNTSDIMIGIPYKLDGIGGTNYTINYARTKMKPIYIIHRDGKIENIHIMMPTNFTYIDSSIAPFSISRISDNLFICKLNETLSINAFKIPKRVVINLVSYSLSDREEILGEYGYRRDISNNFFDSHDETVGYISNFKIAELIIKSKFKI